MSTPDAAQIKSVVEVGIFENHKSHFKSQIQAIPRSGSSTVGSLVLDALTQVNTADLLLLPRSAQMKETPQQNVIAQSLVCTLQSMGLCSPSPGHLHPACASTLNRRAAALKPYTPGFRYGSLQTRDRPVKDRLCERTEREG